MASKTVISIVGKQGTGKSTIAKRVAQNLSTQYIETSDVVAAEIDNAIPRKDMTVTRYKTQTDPDWLGKAVYERIFPMYKPRVRTVVLSGVREVEVHKYLLRRQLKIIPIEVVCDPDTRCKRLLDLGTVRSVEHFVDQDLEERKMGLDEVLDQARFTITTSDATSPSTLARGIVKKLVKEGYTLR